MQQPVLCALVLSALSLSLTAQDPQCFYIPDNAPGVGTCNSFPFGGGAFTYQTLIPASELAEYEAAFKEQLDCLAQWWPDLPLKDFLPKPPEDSTRTAIKLLGPDPKSAAAIAEELGLKPQANPNNRVDKDLDSHFDGLFRVGEAALSGGMKVGLYLATVREWPLRSAERERFRRKIFENIRGKAFLTRTTEAVRVVYYDVAVRILQERRQVTPCYGGISNIHMNYDGEICRAACSAATRRWDRSASGTTT